MDPHGSGVGPIDSLPGFRRRFIVTPSSNRVSAEVEDDYHCMGVAVHHDGEAATKIEAVMQRAPWTTCPGAIAAVEQTFTGVPLKGFAARGEKRTNCTHLHDLATLAAAHAFDSAPVVFDILVSDPVNGQRQSQLRRNGTPLLRWVQSEGLFVEPAELAGKSFEQLRAWMDSLDPERQEAARLLRWGATIAHGRVIPWERQSDSSRMPIGNCYTFQPERVADARRVGQVRDFSNGPQPLEEHRPAPGRAADPHHSNRDPRVAH
jgi:hypothetical protein